MSDILKIFQDQFLGLDFSYSKTTLEPLQGNACHVTYQLKTSSINLWLADQSYNRIPISALWFVSQP